MKKLLIALLGTVALSVNLAHAHGNMKPEHGGVVQMVGEMSFELVTGADKAEVYLADDGEALSSEGMSGKLTVTVNGARSETPLVAAGANKLEARGVKIPSGAKVAVMVVRADQSKMSASFTIK